MLLFCCDQIVGAFLKLSRTFAQPFSVLLHILELLFEQGQHLVEFLAQRPRTNRAGAVGTGFSQLFDLVFQLVVALEVLLQLGAHVLSFLRPLTALRREQLRRDLLLLLL